jgi:hypothetical protein
MAEVFLVALPLMATLVAALLAAVPVGLLSQHVPRQLSGYAALIQFSLLGVAVLVESLSPGGADACTENTASRETILWIGAGTALAGGLVIAASLRHRSHRELIVPALVLPYVVALLLVFQIAPCLN